MNYDNSNYRKQFSVVFPNVFELSGKKVLFRLETDRGLASFSGKFEIHKVQESGDSFIDIFSQELIGPNDPLNTAGWSLHLSQAHTDSITPANSNDLGIDYVVERPFEFRHHIPDTLNHQDEFHKRRASSGPAAHIFR